MIGFFFTVENSLPDAQSDFKEDLFLSLSKQIFYREAFVSVNSDF